MWEKTTLSPHLRSVRENRGSRYSSPKWHGGELFLRELLVGGSWPKLSPKAHSPITYVNRVGLKAWFRDPIPHYSRSKTNNCYSVNKETMKYLPFFFRMSFLSLFLGIPLLPGVSNLFKKKKREGSVLVCLPGNSRCLVGSDSMTVRATVNRRDLRDLLNPSPSTLGLPPLCLFFLSVFYSPFLLLFSDVHLPSSLWHFFILSLPACATEYRH